MISRFFVEFTQSSNGVPCRELKMIAVNYLKGDFKIDLICLLPLQMIPLKNNRNYLFFIIKMVRFLRGLELFDVQKIMQFFKRLSQEYIQDMVDTNWNLANSKLHDNSKIVSLLILSYFLRTLKLVVIITNVSYFLGIFWYIYCEAEIDFFGEGHEGETEHFQIYFDMRDSEPSRISLITTYFAFTSLSTVGFGDFHPRSNNERLICALILLFGVAIFSMIMGDFIDIL